MDELVNWLREQSHAQGRIRHTRREPGREAEYDEIAVHHRVETALEASGIDRLYRHQTGAIRAVRDGGNVVVATPTASGKSLVYTIPAVEGVLEAGRRSLYVAPMRALINDQETAITEFTSELGFGPRVSVAQYTGQQSQSEKRRIRDDQPHVLLTTPDMLHMGILPHAHRLWEWFFRSLQYIIIDEVHEYRGVFGSHVALVLRRLARLAERFDSKPQYICCSATIGNPVEHASAVTGQAAESFSLIDEDTSAAGPRQWLFWNPPLKAQATDGGAVTNEDEGQAGESDARGDRRSPHPETARLLADLVQRDYQTLVFTGARQTAERYAERTASLLGQRGAHDLAEVIGAYQASLTQDTRETIEGRLQNGSLRGVWSTNALELGIDVGSLDAVILDGYPGTRMETQQRAGRAGRGTEPSLVVLVGGQDQLDQYLMANPPAFFEEPPERALVNPSNDELLPDHVRCAARENWLKTDDEAYIGDRFPEVVAALEEAGELERRSTRYGTRWTVAGDENPQMATNLRTIEEHEICLVDAARDETIARLSLSDALRDAHPGAIYYHQGRTYEVAELDIDRGRAFLRETNATYYTRAIREKDITIETEFDERVVESHSGLPVTLAEATIVQRIDRYMRYHGPDDDGEVVELVEPLPETSLRTETLYFPIPPSIEEGIRLASEDEEGFIGALHALEHGMISLFPLKLLCDRRDIGGLSTALHPGTGRGTVFIHDGHPGGVGLARGGFASVGELFEETQAMIAACQCESGCPSCIHSPHCGNANTALNKELAVELVSLLESTEE